MFQLLTSQMRQPLEKFFNECVEKKRYNASKINDLWAEVVFQPEDLNSCLGVKNRFVCIHTDPNESTCKWLFVSVDKDQVEINLFVVLTDSSTLNPTLDLSKELGQLEHLPSKKISIVDTIPQDHPAEIDSYYLKKQSNSISLYWADTEHGLVIPLSPSTIDFDVYQSKLSALFAAVESADENNALLLLKNLLPETRDYEKKMGYEVAVDADPTVLTDDRILINHHCALRSGDEDTHFNVFKAALPLYQKYFPDIPDKVIQKMAAFIDKQCAAYVQRRVSLANKIMEEHDATISALENLLTPPRNDYPFCKWDCFDLMDIAEWIHVKGGLEPAKRLCDFLTRTRAYMEDGIRRRAHQLRINIMMDKTYPVEDKAAHSRMICKYVLEQAKSTRKEDDIRLAQAMVNSYVLYSMGMNREQLPKSFEIPLILQQADQLRQQNILIQQLTAKLGQQNTEQAASVQTPMRLSQGGESSSRGAAHGNFLSLNQ